MKSTDKIQDLLPIGYLFLVVLGMLKESLLFYQLGIPILKYSTIMDILISPIATMTSHYLILIVLVLFFYFFFKLPSILMKFGHKKWVQKTFEVDSSKIELPEPERKNYFNLLAVKGLAGMMISFFLGFGFSEGYSVASKIKNNQLKYDFKLTYSSGDSEMIGLIDSNSAYYFYVSKGNKNIKITPVGSIKNIELVYNKQLK